MPSRRRASALVALALLLVTSACGARLSPAQQAAAKGEGNQTAAITPAAYGGPSATGATAAPTAAVVSGASAGAGPSAVGGQTGEPGAVASAGGGETPCAAAPGSTDPGVTDTEIKVGNVSTIGGPVPGLATTLVNGAQAYFAYRNKVFGGVCGRKLTMLTADDRLDAGQNRSETLNLRDRVLGFVGWFSAVDDGGASVLDGTNIPDVGLAIGAQRVALPNNFSPNPFDPTAASNGQIPVFRHFHDAYGVSRGGVVWPAQATARKKGQNFAADMQAAGIDPVSQNEVALTETNYVGVATKMRDEGVDIVVTALEVNGTARLAQAFKQIGYTPKVAYYGAQAYGRVFTELAGPAAEGTLLALSFDVAEDTANPAVATMVQWYRTVNPGGDLDTLAIEGWTAAAMFVKALEMAGPAPTRDKVLAALGTFHAYDADGLIAPIDAAGKVPPPCFLVETYEGGQWRRVTPPDTGFIC
jgi:ABC-type branched-subunit amino acid transport system substrate-binding protein